MDHTSDIALALEIHQRLNNNVGVTENAIFSINGRDKEYVPKTLVDNTLELIDPTPNIYTLFVQFNTKYFWNKLLPVEVKWSNRMTTCAGVCSFHPRNQQCVITLSAPLLKLRPRKDLVETLLHEMIHGYLFLTNNNRDRGGHGPEFHKHMYRINKEAGTNITVYHDFHDEVKLYQQHWWRCNGPCQKKSPYFGTVRRAANRAPGPSDYWWSRHQQSCGGQFIKVREPEKPVAKSKEVSGKKLPNIPKTKDIADWFKKPDKPSPIVTKATPKTLLDDPAGSKAASSSVPTINNKPSTFTKLGNNSNNIHGWGVGGPNGSAAQTPSSSKVVTKNPKFTATGVLGGSGTGKSNLLDKFSSKNVSELKKPTKQVAENRNGYDKLFGNGKTGLSETPNKRKSNDFNTTSKKLAKIEIDKLPESTNCPVCDEVVRISKLNDHLDECLLPKKSSNENHSTPKSSGSSENRKVQISSPIVISDSSPENSPVIKERQKCLVCNELIELGVTLNEHLDACFGSAFTDDSISEFEENDENTDDNQNGEKNFPCPICMTLINESLMNQHLDTCLNKDLLKNYIE